MSAPFPFLQEWLNRAPQDHPLHSLVSKAATNSEQDSFAVEAVTAFEDLIEILEQAQPLRLDSVRADFRHARTFDELLDARAELVAGAKLGRAGVLFDFGQRNACPQPDLVLREMDLGIEVKARRLNGLRDLHDELEDALAAIDAHVLVHLIPDSQPLIIKADVRARVVEETLQRVRNGDLSTTVTVVEQPWAARKQLLLSVRILEAPGPPYSSRVVITNGFWSSEPGPHLRDAEEQVRAVLESEQKVRQAKSMPTILLVDVARTGVAWIRTPAVWARHLAALIPENSPFVGVAVMIPTLDSSDVAISLGLRANLPEQVRDAVQKLAHRLGLIGI